MIRVLSTALFSVRDRKARLQLSNPCSRWPQSTKILKPMPRPELHLLLRSRPIPTRGASDKVHRQILRRITSQTNRSRFLDCNSFTAA